MTFETQEGFERAKNLAYSVDWKGKVEADQDFFEAPLYFTEAPEPSNIIWENRMVTPQEQKLRKVINLVILIISLACSGYLFKIGKE